MGNWLNNDIALASLSQTNTDGSHHKIIDCEVTRVLVTSLVLLIICMLGLNIAVCILCVLFLFSAVGFLCGFRYGVLCEM